MKQFGGPVLFLDRSDINTDEIIPAKYLTEIFEENNIKDMPNIYIAEMLCDWIGAGKVYSKEKWNQHEPLAYYLKVRDSRIIHPDTEALILDFLTTIDEKGLKEFYAKAKNKEIKRLYENS